MQGNYSATLVIGSLAVAILASHTALDLAARVTTARGRAAFAWLTGGALAMGFGIWAMHFIGMLAFRLPIPLGYAMDLTLVSLAIAGVCSALALWIASRPQLPMARLAMGGIAMGAGIAAMHYVGMAAMRMTPAIHYDPMLFALSIAAAVVSATAALWIAVRLRREAKARWLHRLGAAGVMGCAIAGMHYLGMAAARFPAGALCLSAREGAIPPPVLAAGLFAVALAILSASLLIALFGRRMHSAAALADRLGDDNRRLQQAALHDPLTGLPNRMLFEDRLSQAVERARRGGGGFALMFVDLDGFKDVNDRCGHHAGDALLKEIAARVGRLTRASDTFCRLAGDEFLLLAETPARADAESLAKRLADLVAAPFQLETQTVAVSASIGIALYPEDATTGAGLLERADAAMYRAKDGGGNAWRFASPQPSAAIACSIAEPLFRPRFDIRAARIAGMHATAAEGGTRPEALIAASLAALARRDFGEARIDHISVAVSDRAILTEGFRIHLRRLLDAHGVPPQRLILEIADSAMPDAGRAVDALSRLRQCGVRLAIGGFGGGRSGIRHLGAAVIDEVRIDPALATAGSMMVGATTALAHALGVKVAMDGVDSQRHLSEYRACGCDHALGPLFGPAVPAEEALAAAPPRLLRAV